MRSALALGAVALAGCYQSLGAGYANVIGEDEPHAFEGSWLVAIKNEGPGEPGVYGKVTVLGGASGLRAADVLGAWIEADLDPGLIFFRPGLAFFVIGTEARPGEDELWVGVGAEADLGIMFEVENDAFLEVGVRGGADLSYSGVGGGGFFGAFLALGWWWDGPDWVTH